MLRCAIYFFLAQYHSKRLVKDDNFKLGFRRTKEKLWVIPQLQQLLSFCLYEVCPRLTAAQVHSTLAKCSLESAAATDLRKVQLKQKT